MYYQSSVNKGADQLGGYREADLRLCFHLCRLLVFPWGGSIMYSIFLFVSILCCSMYIWPTYKVLTVWTLVLIVQVPGYCLPLTFILVQSSMCTLTCFQSISLEMLYVGIVKT